MPRSSSFLISVASEKRSGGWVSWPLDSALSTGTYLAFAQRGQDSFLIGEFGFGVVGTFDVGATKSRELNAQPRRAQSQLDAAFKVHDRRQRRDESHLVLGESGVDHLGGDGALPDQVVDREFVTAQLRLCLVKRAKRLAGGSNRLVRLLRVLHLAVVATRHVGDVVVAVHRRRHRARGVDRLVRQRGRVGAHVGDPTLLVEPLGGAHRALGVEAQFSARLDLHRRGHEGRLGSLRPRGRGDRDNVSRRARRVVRRSTWPRPRSSISTETLASSWPDASKFLPVAKREAVHRLERRVERRALRARARAFTSNQVAERKAIRSRSRSQTRRMATDCTRPAERALSTARHSTGETS